MKKTILSALISMALLQNLEAMNVIYPGTLDTTFASPQGYLTDTNLLGAQAVGVDTDDNVYVGGRNSSQEFAVAMFDDAGALNTAYGTDGYARVAIGSSSAISALAVNSVRKVIAGGFSPTIGTMQGALARFTSIGELDTATFAAPNGYTLVSVPGAGSSSIKALILDGSDNIYILCNASMDAGTGFAIGKYDDSGQIVNGFGVNGFATGQVGQFMDMRALVRDASGNLFAGGSVTINNKKQFFITKYAANGTLDSSFGTSSGYTVTALSQDAQIMAIGLDANGNILVAGFIGESPTSIIVARYTPQGILDTSFGSPRGYTILSIGMGSCAANALLVDQTNGVVFGGFATKPDSFFLLGHVTSLGVLDKLFGSALGYTITSQIPESTLNALAFTSQQNILATGIANDGASTTALAQYLKVAPVALSSTTSVPNSFPALVGLTGENCNATLLQFTILSGPSHGTISGFTQPTVVTPTQIATCSYTPQANYTGPDSITFQVANGSLVSDPATVAITVVNTTPASSNGGGSSTLAGSSALNLIKKYYNPVKKQTLTNESLIISKEG